MSVFHQTSNRPCGLSVFTLAVALWNLVGISDLPTAQADDAGKVLLRYRFQPEQTVRYDVSLKDDYKIQVGNDKDEPYSHQKSVKNYVVKTVEPDGTAILELTIESVDLEIFQNGETFKFNSAEDTDTQGQPVFEAMGSLVGRPHLQLKMSSRGEVSAFVPLVPGDQVPDNPGQVAFDVLLRLPEEPIAVGGIWKEDFEVHLPIPESKLRKTVKMQRHYTLKSLENSMATIELQTKILTILDDPTHQMQLLRRTPRGTIVIDLERGLLVSKEFRQDNEVSGFEMGPSFMGFKQHSIEKLHEHQTAEGPKSAER
ncbi:hypothetical protein SH661x_003220 [Planctomicrobium sp. SH661]|uniref:hypothetical protein n=1 Tax=Planctomicrobium sp. SH661 TaxID=3448124 RepID=UPI003F5B8DA3